MAKKKAEDEDFPVYIVSRRLKGKKKKWEDYDSPVFTDSDECEQFVEMERKAYPYYEFRVEKF